MRIGIAGLGRMGAAIGLRLIESGHELVVWNRTPGKTGRDRRRPFGSRGRFAADLTTDERISDAFGDKHLAPALELGRPRFLWAFAAESCSNNCAAAVSVGKG